MKRIQPRAQGRAFRILKRTSHITIVLKEKEETLAAKAENDKKASKPAKKAAAKKTAAQKEVASEKPASEDKPKKPRAPRKKADTAAAEVKAEATETVDTAAQAAQE